MVNDKVCTQCGGSTLAANGLPYTYFIRLWDDEQATPLVEGMCEHCANIAAHANELLKELKWAVTSYYMGEGITNAGAAELIKKLDPSWQVPWGDAPLD